VHFPKRGICDSTAEDFLYMHRHTYFCGDHRYGKTQKASGRILIYLAFGGRHYRNTCNLGAFANIPEPTGRDSVSCIFCIFHGSCLFNTHEFATFHENFFPVQSNEKHRPEASYIGVGSQKKHTQKLENQSGSMPL
jgi:hypothetical protein